MIVHKLAIFGLFAVISFGIPVWAIVSQVSERSHVKQWLQEAGTYELVIDSSFQFIQEEADAQTLGSALQENQFIDYESLIGIIKDALTPKYLQQQTEGMIDGFYDWLEYQVAEPQFLFDLSPVRQQVSENLRLELNARLSVMPVCEAAELTEDFDLLTAHCLPPGVDLSQTIDETVDSLAGEDGLLVSFSQEDLKLSEDTLRDVPRYFNSSYWAAMWLLPAIGGVFLVLTAVTTKSLRRGLRRVGWTLISASVITFFLALLLTQAKSISNGLLANIASSSDAPEGSAQAIVEVLQPLLVVIIASIARLMAWIAGGFIAGGTILLIGIRFMKHRSHRPEADSQPTHAEIVTETQPDDEVPDKGPESEEIVTSAEPVVNESSDDSIQADSEPEEKETFGSLESVTTNVVVRSSPNTDPIAPPVIADTAAATPKAADRPESPQQPPSAGTKSKRIAVTINDESRNVRIERQK